MDEKIDSVFLAYKKYFSEKDALHKAIENYNCAYALSIIIGDDLYKAIRHKIYEHFNTII